MALQLTKPGKTFPIVPTLVFCGVAILLYKIFKSPELDRQIDKVMGTFHETN